MRSNNFIASPSIRLKYFSLYAILIILFFIFAFSNISFNERSSNPDYYSELNEVKVFPFQRARFDNKRIIRIYDWIWTGRRWNDLMENLDVCLSTQGSMDRIHWILDVVDHWHGPVSLAVYIASPDEWTGLNILVNHFQKCSYRFRDFVSIHVAVPASARGLNVEVVDSDAFLFGDVGCDETEDFIQRIVNKYQPGPEAKYFMTMYPQNHMRNIARKGCGTEWVWSTDIDIIPRPHSVQLLQEFHDSDEARNCSKCAFVIPTFELKSSIRYPSTKAELVQDFKEHLARPFHFAIWVHAHNATDYRTWSKTNLEEGSIKMSHSVVETLLEYYEPFYIASDTIPPFEERFIGYGFTRSSQVQEALAEGWTFKVITPIFAIHWGLQSRKTLISPDNELKIRDKQTMRNSKIFSAFLKELQFRKSLRRRF